MADPAPQEPILVEARADILPRKEQDIPLFDEQTALRLVPVSSLRIDASYQRRVSRGGERTMRTMAKAFSWARFGAICVAPYGDDYVIIDGQHRAIVAASLNIEHIPAVITTADYVSQADSFIGINNIRTGVGPIDRFRARVAAREEDALELKSLLDELSIDTDVPAGAGLGPKQTRAITRLEKMQKVFGKGTLFTALEMLLDAQPATSDLLTALTIQAVTGATHQVIEGEGDLERLFKVIEEMDPVSLNDDAGSLVRMLGGSRAHHARSLLLKSYNKGLTAAKVIS